MRVGGQLHAPPDGKENVRFAFYLKIKQFFPLYLIFRLIDNYEDLLGFFYT
jgi:hypothetical protein